MKKHNILNLIGLRCPEPIMVIRKTLRNMKNHEKVLVLTDDPSTTRDIPNFCYFMEHKLLEHQIKIRPYHYLLQKGL